MTGRFQKGPSLRTPFGKNEFLRSTDYLSESGTLACATVPAVTIDGFTGQKIAQPGLILAKITSGGDTDKVGPFDSGATDGRQTKANIVGLLNTFVPWQTMERDVDISFVYDAWVIAALCSGYEAGVAKTLPQLVTDTILALTDFQTAGTSTGVGGMDIRFAKPAATVLGTDFGTFPI